uniref:Glutathione S-transferase n=1 Tax=Daphnia galeata TaxID=27404 RepID=A0A8J2RI98_9CRUS|nr:unnamed protein product [Daphnia galeata]
MASVKTGYWNIRGYMQPIRLLLAYAGVEHEDKRYNFGPAPDYDSSEWLKDKFNLGLDFPNCPYYIDGDVKLSQTFAILKYLGRKHNLAPKTEEEHIRVDLIEAEAEDMRTKWSTLCYHADFEKMKPEYVKNAPVKLKEISAFLGSHPYFAGQNITYIDFLIYELMDQNSQLIPGLLDEFPNLKEFHARIGGLEKVASYLSSDKCIKYPFNGPMAQWGGK